MKLPSILSVISVSLVLDDLALASLLARSDPQAADAPLTVSAATVEAAITCPNGIESKDGGIVFLVHGTASTGYESFGVGPYAVLLPDTEPGFDICWVDLPNRSLADVQISSQYVVQGIKYLASQSSTGQVALVGHSQGAGLNIPWALSFWPSTNSLVSDFVALAGDFLGTDEGWSSCTTINLTDPGDGCPEALIQQTYGSHLLAAQDQIFKGGLVTATSLYTVYDDVIQPETPPLGPTSELAGAANFYLQELCGVDHYADHIDMLFDPAAYAMAVDALTHSGPASIMRFNPYSCLNYGPGGTGLNFSSVIPLVEAGWNGMSAFENTDVYSNVEAALASYVCERVSDATCGETFAPPPPVV